MTSHDKVIKILLDHPQEYMGSYRLRYESRLGTNEFHRVIQDLTASGRIVEGLDKDGFRTYRITQ